MEQEKGNLNKLPFFFHYCTGGILAVSGGILTAVSTGFIVSVGTEIAVSRLMLSVVPETFLVELQADRDNIKNPLKTRLKYAFFMGCDLNSMI